MKSAGTTQIVLVTAPNLGTARKLVRLALEQKLVACGNLIPKIESHYWWKGKLEKAAEVLILFKTVSARLPQLEELVLAHHPYDTPEILALPIGKGTASYLNWIHASVGASAEFNR